MVTLIIALLTLLRVSAIAASRCPNISLTEDTKPLYLVTLVPFSSSIGVVAGALVAQEEINNLADILPGYHIELIIKERESCSSDQIGTGLSNVLKYTIDPPCRPVVAVSGLGCSSHAAVMSPIIGHDGFDLIHLSIANSPIFQSQIHRFPHLWTFLGSATTYSDMILALMDQFNWERVGLVYNSGSVFASELAQYFEQDLKLKGKMLVFTKEISGKTEIYFDQAISCIKSQGVTILVAMLGAEQDSILVTRALEGGLLYPQYTWIHVEIRPKWLVSDDRENIFSGIQGHIFLFPWTTAAHNQSSHLISDDSAFKWKFDNKLPQLKDLYNESDIISEVEFGAYYYDQVWALALALNNSLPLLRDKNLLLDNYTIGQPEITDVIEEQMARLSFQGAGGLVEFNQNRSVSTPVQIIWFINKTELNVGIYNPLNVTNFHANINTSDLPKDRIDDEYALISLPVAILLYIATSAVIIFTTVQLYLYMYLHYKNCKVIRATSPYLRLVMFAGCYLYCVAAIFTITQGSFVLSPVMFSTAICLLLLSVVNAFSLTLTTLFIIQLRVYHIFRSSNQLKSGLGRKFKNYSLFSSFSCFRSLQTLSSCLL